MSTQRSIRTTVRRTEVDRKQWAATLQVLMALEVTGRGQSQTEMLPFGVVMEAPPFFSYGVELASGELISGDYPYVSCGVREWELDEQDHYLGAYVWMNVDSYNSYDLLVRLSFEGIALQAVEFIQR